MSLRKKISKEILEYKKSIIDIKLNNIDSSEKLKKIIDYAALCYAYREFDECWKYYKFNLLRQNKIEKFPDSLKDKNKKIKFLENITDLKPGDHLLIWDDGGFGDLILHFRLLQLFPKNINFKIKLRNNLKWIFKIHKDKFIIDDTLLKFNYHISFMQLENLFKFNSLKYNFNFNYLISKKNNKWENYFKQFNKNQKVGLVINTNTSKRKNINFKYIKILIEKNPNKKFFLIYLNPTTEIINYEKICSNLIILSNIDKINPFEDTFNIVKNLNLLITIDTAVAHLAGYLNLKTMLLLNFPHHYYWGIEEKYSIFYKNFKIIRAKKKNDWLSVINEINI